MRTLLERTLNRVWLLRNSRKSMVMGLLASLMAIALLAAACGGDDEEKDSAPTGSETPKYGGSIKVGLLADHTGFDAPLLAGVPDIQILQHTNDTLIMRHTRTLELVPMLATSWEPSADLMSWTFHLREGVKFSHGKEFKAEDVKFTLDRLFEVDSPLAGVLDSIEETVIVDDYTVRFDLNTPNAFLPDLILRYHAQMTPSDVDPARFATETFGTGPYTLEEFVVGEFAVLKKRDDYFLEGLPYLDEIIFVYLPDPTTRAEALKAGTIDMIYALETENVPALEQHPDTRVSVATGAAYMNLAMNVTEPPFDNILVRKALQAATNRELILQASQFGLGGIAYDHPITLDDPVFNPSCKPPDYDPELAKSLLAQAGYPDGIELTLYTSSAGAAMVPMATAFQQSAKAAGIEITISVMPEDVYWSDGWMVKPFTTVWWGGRIPDEAFSIVYKSDAAWNESFYKNPEVDRLILKARGEPNLADRKVTYGELQCLLIDEVPRIIPVFRPLFIGLRNDVKDVEANWEDLLYLREGWLDR